MSKFRKALMAAFGALVSALVTVVLATGKAPDPAALVSAGILALGAGVATYRVPNALAKPVTPPAG